MTRITILLKKIAFPFAIAIAFLAAFVCFHYSKIEIIPVEITKELGEEPSDDIFDYVNVEEKYKKIVRKTSKFDRSDIDECKAGDYEAHIYYMGREILVSVHIVDTTPPVVTVKSKLLFEGDYYAVSEMLDIMDESKCEIILPENMGNSDKQMAHVGDAYTVSVKDASGNITTQEIRLHVLNKGGAGKDYFFEQNAIICENAVVIDEIEDVFRYGGSIDYLSQKEDGELIVHERGYSNLSGATYFFQKKGTTYEFSHSEEDYESTWFEGMEKCPEKYRDYMGKIWISDADMLESSFRPKLSFYFTKITDSYVEGRYVLACDYLAMPPTPASTSKYLSCSNEKLFSGWIKDGAAYCTDMESGETLELFFQEKGRMEYRTWRMEESEGCTPYTTQSNPNFSIDDKQAIPIETGRWSGCQMITGVLKGTEGKKYSVVYITDMENNILYDLGCRGDEILNLQLVDGEQTMLKNLEIHFSNKSMDDTWIQKADGTFYYETDWRAFLVGMQQK